MGKTVSFFKSILLFLTIPCLVWGYSQNIPCADLQPSDLAVKAEELLSYHPTYHAIDQELSRRILQSFCDELDPLKIYLLKDEVVNFFSPTNEMLNMVSKAYVNGDVSFFEDLYCVMARAIKRRALYDEALSKEILPKAISLKTDEFDFVATEEELFQRWILIKAVQTQAAASLETKLQEAALQRIQKRRSLFEQQRTIPAGPVRLKVLSTLMMKAFAESLDSQTAYYTPQEAKQLLISMQQRLYGIGILMRDDADGFSVIKVVEGGPADRQKVLQLGDKIIAVNGEPVIGLDIGEVVDLIRGDEGSEVVLKIVRKTKEKAEETLLSKEIRVKRGEVVFQEMRYGSKVEPFGGGVLAYVRLHSFYQDEETSSYQDLFTILDEFQRGQNVKGLILDLRSNPGGLLSQAVAVSGLFLDKGVIVTVKDDEGKQVHMRNFATTKKWDGPLIVLVNRASASSAEIVAQVLQDWGRAIIVGDDRSFGKGSFQLFSLIPDGVTPPNPMGEYKVTRGCYYTVSGKSPQGTGVISDVVVPGSLSFARIGEMYAKYPLPQDVISAHYNDTFDDIPYLQRGIARTLYRKDRQYRLERYTKMIPMLRKKSAERLKNNMQYAAYLEKIEKLGDDVVMVADEPEKEADYQLEEGFFILKDLVDGLAGASVKSLLQK